MRTYNTREDLKEFFKTDNEHAINVIIEWVINTYMYVPCSDDNGVYLEDLQYESLNYGDGFVYKPYKDAKAIIEDVIRWTKDKKENIADIDFYDIDYKEFLYDIDYREFLDDIINTLSSII